MCLNDRPFTELESTAATMNLPPNKETDEMPAVILLPFLGRLAAECVIAAAVALATVVVAERLASNA